MHIMMFEDIAFAVFPSWEVPSLNFSHPFQKVYNNLVSTLHLKLRAFKPRIQSSAELDGKPG